MLQRQGCQVFIGRMTAVEFLPICMTNVVQIRKKTCQQHLIIYCVLSRYAVPLTLAIYCGSSVSNTVPVPL
jgi:hypothetical protein